MLIMKRPSAWKESAPVTAYVHMQVQRRFGKGWYAGTVTEVDERSKKFKIEYEDGDDEVMDQDTMCDLREKGEMLVKHCHDKEFIRRVARKYVETKRAKKKTTTGVAFTSKHGKGIVQVNHQGIISVLAVDSDSSAETDSSA
jgi:hypothetical protein